MALAASNAGVYVVIAGDSTVVRLDPTSGKRLRSTRIATLSAATRPVVALAPRFGARGRTVTATIPLSGGRLDSTSVVTRDRAIQDGRALLELWQGGIVTRGGSPKTSHGVTVGIAAASGGLVGELSSPRGAFERLAVSRAKSGSIVLTLTKPSPPPKQTTTTTPPPTPTPQPTTTAPAPPPTPTVTIGSP